MKPLIIARPGELENSDFARLELMGYNVLIADPNDVRVYPDRTLRDEIAVAALTGLIANDVYAAWARDPQREEELGCAGWKLIAQLAYKQADAMLAERNKQTACPKPESEL